MKTDVQTPMQIFALPQHLVVPLFQRPYVWDETDQWAPLWQDIRRLADLRLREPHTVATHFLGAVVLQAQDGQQGHMPASNIIDGQQRLTTLQILVDATAAVLDEAGLDALSSQLELLTHNQEMFVSAGQSRLKLRHTNRDRDSFDEVMNTEPPVEHASLKHSGSLIVRAHDFFVGAVSEWLNAPSDFEVADRANVLVPVLTAGLQLVTINLSASENSQEIFETLNARGTPLTAADLIKNFVFQRLQAEGADTAAAYAQAWPFDTKFWEVQVSAGRYLVSRSSLFLNQWLISRTGDEVGPQSTFTRFKSYIEHESSSSMSELLPIIQQQAELYERWTIAAADPDRQLSVTEMAVYRMQANRIELLKPLLIWLHSPDAAIPDWVADKVIATAESWIVRRQLMRLTSSDLGRILSELIRVHRYEPAENLPDRVSSHLSRLNVSSTYWPDDDEIRASLSTELVYRRFPRGRLRMLLEAVEDSYRGETSAGQVARRGLPIEHVLPQKWETNWTVEGLEAEQSRASHVHRLGNLTLLTAPLNSKVSNGGWGSKRDAFKQHDTMLLTSRLLAAAEDGGWDEVAIDSRTDTLLDAILSVWPVPEGHVGEIVDPHSKEPDWVEVKHLVIAGLLEPGTRLHPRPGKWGDAEAVVLANGLLEIDGKSFESPSGAGRHLRGASTNGWYFWRLEDGRTLKDVRAVYRGDDPKKSEDQFDWAPLHAVLEALPEGYWTSYGALADFAGTAAQPLGQHITGCSMCANAHRVLKAGGTAVSNFRWRDPTDERDPADLLRSEGVNIVDGAADPACELNAEELAALVD